MIKINIYCVGTLKENYLKEALEEYKKDFLNIQNWILSR